MRVAIMAIIAISQKFKIMGGVSTHQRLAAVADNCT
jgi:hypothetical protein